VSPKPSPAAPTASFLPAPRPQGASRYRPPELLRDLRLLDALALTGSSEQAGRWLAISQPTVSRRYRRLAEDFGLGTRLRLARCGSLQSSLSLDQLRLGARWHRFEAGVALLGTDPLHQGLLDGLPGLLPLPHRFRCCRDWQALVQTGVIDGALVSSLELELELETDVGMEVAMEMGQAHGHALNPGPQHPGGAAGATVQAQATGPGLGWPPAADPVVRLPLGPLPLRLASVAGTDAAEGQGGDGCGSEAANTPRLLVPPAPLAPGLRTLLAGQGAMVACTAAAVHNLYAWRRQMVVQNLAAAIPAPLLGHGSGPLADLMPLERTSRTSSLQEQLWLLLPQEWPAIPVLQQAVQTLRQLAVAAAAPA
jgi:hypothetical protein